MIDEPLPLRVQAAEQFNTFDQRLDFVGATDDCRSTVWVLLLRALA